jgi:acyl-CoA thioester hydrolase
MMKSGCYSDARNIHRKRVFKGYTHMSEINLEAKPTPKCRECFQFFTNFQTRWRDNDQYGHVNNVIYYELFDSAINQFLMLNNILDLKSGSTVFLVASSGCNYFSELVYPDNVEVGLSVSRLGKSAVTYDLGIFKSDAFKTAAAGYCVHVNVARDDYRPLPIAPGKRQVFERLFVSN